MGADMSGGTKHSRVRTVGSTLLLKFRVLLNIIRLLLPDDPRNYSGPNRVVSQHYCDCGLDGWDSFRNYAWVMSTSDLNHCILHRSQVNRLLPLRDR